MVFLTSLNILDTGFLTQTSRTNQLASGDRVNGGVAMKLKGVIFSPHASSNLDKSVTPGGSGVGRYPHISDNPDDFTIEITLDSKHINTNNEWETNDMSYVAELWKLTKTKGLKALYYPVKNGVFSDNRNRDSQILYRLGSADTTEDQGDIDITLWNGTIAEASLDLTDVNYLCVRFDDMKIGQTGKNQMTITLSGVITT